MSKLFDSMERENNYTYTENSALTHKSSLNANVDFFAMGSSLRTRTEEEKISLFENAYGEDPLVALKNLFYSRDIRGGQGERQTFRDIMVEFYSSNDSATRGLSVQIKKNLLFLFPEYGRWDDLIYVINQPSVREEYRKYAYEFIIEMQYHLDLERAQKEESISLLSKWLPSINASSKETKRMACITMQYLGLNAAKYRKSLSVLRRHLDVVERKIHSKKYSEINYESVPSKATIQYRKAFMRNDASRFGDYVKAVSEGRAKINAGTLYPYDILKNVYDLFGGAYNLQNSIHSSLRRELQHLENAWNNLPNYLENSDDNVLVVADVSGSMFPEAIAVSTSLALYTAERNKGTFHNQFLTFSGNPELVKLNKHDSFLTRVKKIMGSNWGMNTDLQKTFDLILYSAVKAKVPKKEMPSTVVIISDMEFDSAIAYTNSYKKDSTNFEAIKKKYFESGYQMPKIVFWNVESRNNQSPVTKDERGVILASGRSPVVLKHALNGEDINPEEFMLQVLNSERYQNVENAITETLK